MSAVSASSSRNARNEPLYKIDDILEYERNIHGWTHRMRVTVLRNPVWVEEDENGDSVHQWRYAVTDADITKTRHIYVANERQLSRVTQEEPTQEESTQQDVDSIRENYMQIRRNGRTYYTNAQVDSDSASSDSEYSSDSDDEEVQSAAGGRKYMAEDRAPPSKRQRRKLWENLRF